MGRQRGRKAEKVGEREGEKERGRQRKRECRNVWVCDSVTQHNPTHKKKYNGKPFKAGNIFTEEIIF